LYFLIAKLREPASVAGFVVAVVAVVALSVNECLRAKQAKVKMKMLPDGEAFRGDGKHYIGMECRVLGIGCKPDGCENNES
jgi:hypothetical protein